MHDSWYSIIGTFFVSCLSTISALFIIAGIVRLMYTICTGKLHMDNITNAWCNLLLCTLCISICTIVVSLLFKILWIVIVPIMAAILVSHVLHPDIRVHFRSLMGDTACTSQSRSTVLTVLNGILVLCTAVIHVVLQTWDIIFEYRIDIDM